MFMGSEESIFSFVAIPSIFESELSGERSEGKGYHLALGAKQTKGSQSAVDDLSSVGFISVELHFEQGTSALHTKREYKVRWLILVMTLLGSIAGLVGTFGTAMGFEEERWLQRSLKKILKVMNLKQNLIFPLILCVKDLMEIDFIRKIHHLIQFDHPC